MGGSEDLSGEATFEMIFESGGRAGHATIGSAVVPARVVPDKGQHGWEISVRLSSSPKVTQLCDGSAGDST